MEQSPAATAESRHHHNPHHEKQVSIANSIANFHSKRLSHSSFGATEQSLFNRQFAKCHRFEHSIGKGLMAEVKEDTPTVQKSKDELLKEYTSLQKQLQRLKQVGTSTKQKVTAPPSTQHSNQVPLQENSKTNKNKKLHHDSLFVVTSQQLNRRLYTDPPAPFEKKPTQIQVAQRTTTSSSRQETTQIVALKADKDGQADQRLTKKLQHQSLQRLQQPQARNYTVCEEYKDGKPTTGRQLKRSRQLSAKQFVEDRGQIGVLVPNQKNKVHRISYGKQLQLQKQVDSEASYPITHRKSQMSNMTLRSLMTTTHDQHSRKQSNSPSSCLRKYFNQSELTLQSQHKKKLSANENVNKRKRSGQGGKKSHQKLGGRKAANSLESRLKNGIELNIDIGSKIQIALDQNLQVKSHRIIPQGPHQQQQQQQHPHPHSHRQQDHRNSYQSSAPPFLLPVAAIQQPQHFSSMHSLEAAQNSQLDPVFVLQPQILQQPIVEQFLPYQNGPAAGFSNKNNNNYGASPRFASRFDDTFGKLAPFQSQKSTDIANSSRTADMSSKLGLFFRKQQSSAGAHSSPNGSSAEKRSRESRKLPLVDRSCQFSSPSKMQSQSPTTSSKGLKLQSKTSGFTITTTAAGVKRRKSVEIATQTDQKVQRKVQQSTQINRTSPQVLRTVSIPNLLQQRQQKHEPEPDQRSIENLSDDSMEEKLIELKNSRLGTQQRQLSPRQSITQYPPQDVEAFQSVLKSSSSITTGQQHLEVMAKHFEATPVRGETKAYLDDRFRYSTSNKHHQCTSKTNTLLFGQNLQQQHRPQKSHIQAHLHHPSHDLQLKSSAFERQVAELDDNPNSSYFDYTQPRMRLSYAYANGSSGKKQQSGVLWEGIHMSGTSKKSQGMTERKMPLLGDTLRDEQLEVMVLTTNKLLDDEIGTIKQISKGLGGGVLKAKDRQL